MTPAPTSSSAAVNTASEIDRLADTLALQMSDRRFLEMLEHFDENALYIEAASRGMYEKHFEGRREIANRFRQWLDDHVIHDYIVNETLVSGNEIAVHVDVEITNRPMGNRLMRFDQVAVFTVENGLITKAQYFFNGL